MRQQIVGANSVIVSRLTAIEVMSAVARRHREGAIDTTVVNGIHRLLDKHFHQHYMVIDVNDFLTREAIRLITTHPLRAYDAVQLATAKFVNQRLTTRQLAPITFLCADTRLLQIAIAEGIATDNPNNYP